MSIDPVVGVPRQTETGEWVPGWSTLRAYREAVAELKQAQAQLTTDLVAHAGPEQLSANALAAQTAQAGVMATVADIRLEIDAARLDVYA